MINASKSLRHFTFILAMIALICVNTLITKLKITMLIE